MRKYAGVISLALLVFGCGASDDPANAEADVHLVIPVDTRPVHQAPHAPPPISGGTLAVSPDGRHAVAADPDRDRVSVVELASGQVRHLELEPGSEPGRVAIDSQLRAHIALRRTGEVLRIDVARAEELGRTRVCAAPRGLAYDAARGLLHVACADGLLVSLDGQAVQGPATIERSLELEADLRDVIVSGDGLLVTTFKGARLLRLDEGGSVLRRVQPKVVSVPVERAPGSAAPDVRTMEPNLAYRAVPQPDGSVLLLHQQASADMVDIDAEPSPEAPSPYGGGSLSCSSIVQSAVTQIGATGTRSMTLGGAVLAVDMARGPQGELAVALPGLPEPDMPRPIVVDERNGSRGAAPPSQSGVPLGVGPGHIGWYDAGLFGTAPMLSDETVGCRFPTGMPTPGQTTAVAFTAQGALVAQSREPALLVVVHEPPWSTPVVIELGGPSARDTGHDLFHRDSGAGLACASCHGEGGDDGHTWLFSGIGARRTQAVNVGLAGTAPFHWDGDMTDLAMLMEEVFVGRMGGVHQSPERLEALAGWLFALEPWPSMVAPSDPAAERGRALFESAEVGCAICHSGDQLTDNENHDVGKGLRLQVPSLRGVAYRAPFMHDGCAETLRDRFDPVCGGAQHGDTSRLSDAELDDLIAYLRSL